MLWQVLNRDLSFMAYETRFWTPSVQSGSGTALYYSYEVAAAHIIMLGSYAAYSKSSAQVSVCALPAQAQAWLLSKG